MHNELAARWIDPDFGGFERWLRRPIDEALRVQLERLVEDRLAGGVDFIDLPVVDLVGRHQADAEMMVVAVVPGEEMPAEGLGILDAAEPFGKLRLIFQGLEVAFAKRDCRSRYRAGCGIW